jgi:hypothetical protein
MTRQIRKIRIVLLGIPRKKEFHDMEMWLCADCAMSRICNKISWELVPCLESEDDHRFYSTISLVEIWEDFNTRQ